MRSTKDMTDTIGAGAAAAAGAFRRMAITLTGTVTAAKLIWQMTGVRKLDGTLEVQKIEVFQGIGIAARPPSSGKPEAIVIGPADAEVAVAVRDAKTQQAMAGTLKADETAVFNSLAIVHITDATKIKMRSKAGASQPTIRATAYRPAEDTMLTAIKALCTAIAVALAGDPALAGAATAAAAAIDAFKAAAASYLTTVVEVE